jgi:hypothetical protein
LKRTTRWLSRRAVGLHLALLIVAPFCLLAGWWQVHRAASGNTLSYFYAVEWPIFAIIAVCGWWQLLRLSFPPEQRHDDDRVPTRRAPVWDPALETPQLRAYNEYLSGLASGGRPTRWRKGSTPTGHGGAARGQVRVTGCTFQSLPGAVAKDSRATDPREDVPMATDPSELLTNDHRPVEGLDGGTR